MNDLGCKMCSQTKNLLQKNMEKVSDSLSMKFMSNWLRWNLMDVMPIVLVAALKPKITQKTAVATMLNCVRAKFFRLARSIWRAFVWCVKWFQNKQIFTTNERSIWIFVRTFNYMFCQAHEKTCLWSPVAMVTAVATYSYTLHKKLKRNQIKLSVVLVISCGWRS